MIYQLGTKLKGLLRSLKDQTPFLKKQESTIALVVIVVTCSIQVKRHVQLRLDLKPTFLKEGIMVEQHASNQNHNISINNSKLVKQIINQTLLDLLKSIQSKANVINKGNNFFFKESAKFPKSGKNKLYTFYKNKI